MWVSAEDKKITSLAVIVKTYIRMSACAALLHNSINVFFTVYTHKIAKSVVSNLSSDTILKFYQLIYMLM